MHLVSDEHAFLQPCAFTGRGRAQSCCFVVKNNIASVGNKELELHVQCAGGGVPVTVLELGRTLEVEMNYFCCATV